MKKEESLIGKLDWLTIILFSLLMLIGWAVIYSSCYTGDGKSIFDTSLNSGKQFEWIVASFILMAIILIVDSRFYVTFSYVFYVLLMLFIVLVMFVGVEVKGQRNWIRIGSFQMQPSEMAKFAVSLALAKYLSGLNVDIRKWRDKWKAFAIMGFPMLLVLIQGDAGSAIVFVSLVLVLFREGLEPYFLIVGAAATTLGVLALVADKLMLTVVLLAIALVFIYFLKRNKKIIATILGIWLLAVVYIFSVHFAFSKLQAHQRDRINVLLGKEVEAGKDWNIRQSIIAIGSGGFMGKGYLQGTQTKLKFVPEQSTDFIFSSVGEEFGFVGGIVLILLFMALFFRLLYLAERQRSKFSRVYGYCVTSMLFFHFLINMGMAIGVAPVIGIPLPFISYGGSSLLSFTALLFIFIRLDTQRYDVMR